MIQVSRILKYAQLQFFSLFSFQRTTNTIMITSIVIPDEIVIPSAPRPKRWSDIMQVSNNPKFCVYIEPLFILIFYFNSFFQIQSIFDLDFVSVEEFLKKVTFYPSNNIVTESNDDYFAYPNTWNFLLRVLFHLPR